MVTDQYWNCSLVTFVAAIFERKYLPHAGSGVVRIDPFCFLVGCRKKATKPGLALSVIYLSMLYIVLLFIRAPF